MTVAAAPTALVRRLRAEVSGLRPDTSVQGAELVVAATLIGARAMTVMSMLTVTEVMLRDSPRPGVYLATFLAAVASLAAFSIMSIRRRQPLGARGTGVEVAIDTILILVSIATVPIEYRIGSWVGFAPGAALCAAVAAGVSLRLGPYLASLGAIILSYLAFVFPLLGGDVRAIANNALTYVGWSVVARVAASYLRRMARDGDEASATAARLARREAEHRARASIHDGVSLISRLTDGSVSAEQAPVIIAQFERELQRMRAYLRQADDEEQPSCGTHNGPKPLLSGVVHDGARGFDDLGVEVYADLVNGVRVASVVGRTIEQALRTALLNVRWHARAGSVIVHADSDPATDSWTLTVRDDGCGFDVNTTVLNVGIPVLIMDALALVGGSARVESQPGAGTTITMTGPAR